jgi:hypothetical protein
VRYRRGSTDGSRRSGRRPFQAGRKGQWIAGAAQLARQRSSQFIFDASMEAARCRSFIFGLPGLAGMGAMLNPDARGNLAARFEDWFREGDGLARPAQKNDRFSRLLSAWVWGRFAVTLSITKRYVTGHRGPVGVRGHGKYEVTLRNNLRAGPLYFAELYVHRGSAFQASGQQQRVPFVVCIQIPGLRYSTPVQCIHHTRLGLDTTPTIAQQLPVPGHWRG